MVRNSCIRLMLVVALSLVFLVGCTVEPDEDLLKLTIEREFKRNLEHAIQVKSLKCSWIMATETRGETQAQVSFIFPQGLYGEADAEDFLKSDMSVKALTTLENAIEQARSVKSIVLQELFPVDELESQGFVREIVGKDVVIEGTIEVTASKGTNGWTFRLSQPQFSMPKNMYQAVEVHEGDIILGSKEAKAYAKRLEKEIDEFAALVQETLNTATKETQQKLEQDKKAILDLVKKGAHLAVIAEKSGLRESVAFASVNQVNTGTGIVECALILADKPEETLNVTGGLTFELGTPAMFSVALDGKKLTFQLDQSTLTATLDNMRYILVAQDKATFEQELEKAKGKAREWRALQDAENQKKEAFLAGIGKLLSPGSGFEGTWKSSEASGIIGLAIESVTVDGSGCAGYLFDPVNRDKRKPFTGVITKAYPSSTFSITTTKGQGIDTRYDSPELDQLWLTLSSSHTITFAVDGKQLSGKLVAERYSRAEGEFALAPIENFTEIVAQEAAREKERQLLLTQAVQKGSAWLGTYRKSGEAGEFGLYFTTEKEGFITAEIFDIKNPSLRKKLTGALSLAKYADYPITLNTVNNSGLAYDDAHTDFQQSWLRQNQSYSLHLQLVDGKLQGATDYRYTLSLVSMDDYAERMTRWQNEEVRKDMRLKVALQPRNLYKGTWQESSGSGELALAITEVSQTGINFKAQLYDPAHPEKNWPYMGSVVQNKRNIKYLKLVPQTSGHNVRYPSGSTRWRFEYHNSPHSSMDLFVVENGLEGEWRGAKVNLAKTGESLTSLVDKALSSQGAPVKKSASSDSGNKQTDRKQTAVEGQKETPASTPAPTPAPAPVTQKPQKQAASLSPIELPQFAPLGGDDKKDRIMAHLVQHKGKDVVLALQLKAPGKTLSAVRIDNIGGLSSLWHSNDSKALPLRVTNTDNAGLEAFGPMNKEEVVVLRLQDNGAFSTQKTTLRFTAFFKDGTRAMCLLKQ